MRIHHSSQLAFHPGRGKKLEAIRSVEAVRPAAGERETWHPRHGFSGTDRIQADAPLDLRVRRALSAYSNHRSGAEEGVTLWYGVDIYV